MKFETQSGMKIALYLSVTKENTWDSLCDKMFRAVIRIDQAWRHVWSDKEADWPSESYVEEVSSLLSSTVDEKTVTMDELWVEEVIAHIDTNISLLERCKCDWASLLKDLKTEEKVKEERSINE